MSHTGQNGGPCHGILICVNPAETAVDKQFAKTCIAGIEFPRSWANNRGFAPKLTGDRSWRGTCATSLPHAVQFRFPPMGGPVSRSVRLFPALILAFSAFAYAQPKPSAEQRTAHYMESIRQQPSLLLAFLREMPKGGDLHNHLAGAIYAE